MRRGGGDQQRSTAANYSEPIENTAGGKRRRQRTCGQNNRGSCCVQETDDKRAGSGPWMWAGVKGKWKKVRFIRLKNGEKLDANFRRGKTTSQDNRAAAGRGRVIIAAGPSLLRPPRQRPSTSAVECLRTSTTANSPKWRRAVCTLRISAKFFNVFARLFVFQSLTFFFVFHQFSGSFVSYSRVRNSARKCQTIEYVFTWGVGGGEREDCIKIWLRSRNRTENNISSNCIVRWCLPSYPTILPNKPTAPSPLPPRSCIREILSNFLLDQSIVD